MPAGKSAIALFSNQLLTGSYVASTASRISEESLGTLDVVYTTGTAETNNTLEFKIEYSADGVTNWVQESFGDLQSGVNVLTPVEHQIAGATAATAFTGQYFIPLCSRFFRISVKESGVAANFGRVTIYFTIAPGSGQQRNLQETSLSGTVTIGSVNQGTAGSSYWFTKAALATDAIINGSTALTPKFAFANVAAGQTDAAVVTAVALKKIRVLQVAAVTGGTATTLTFNSKPGGAGTAISPLFANAANGGEILSFSPVGWFETVAGEGLSVTTGAGATTGILVTYIEV